MNWPSLADEVFAILPVDRCACLGGGVERVRWRTMAKCTTNEIGLAHSVSAQTKARSFSLVMKRKIYQKNDSRRSRRREGMVGYQLRYFRQMWHWQRIEDGIDCLVVFLGKGRYEIDDQWDQMHIEHRHGDDRWRELIDRFGSDPPHRWRRSAWLVATRAWQWMRSMHWSMSIHQETSDTKIWRKWTYARMTWRMWSSFQILEYSDLLLCRVFSHAIDAMSWIVVVLTWWPVGRRHWTLWRVDKWGVIEWEWCSNPWWNGWNQSPSRAYEDSVSSPEECSERVDAENELYGNILQISHPISTRKTREIHIFYGEIVFDHSPWERIRPIRWWHEWVWRHVAEQRTRCCRIHAHLASVVWSDEANRAMCSAEEARQFDRWPVSRSRSTVRSAAVDEIVANMWLTSWLDEKILVQPINMSNGYWDRWRHTAYQWKRDTIVSRWMPDQRDRRTYCSFPSLPEHSGCVASYTLPLSHLQRQVDDTARPLCLWSWEMTDDRCFLRHSIGSSVLERESFGLTPI